MPASEHGAFEDPKKSAYSIEFYDSAWEREYMEGLEANPSVKRWTKNHGIRIPYYDEDGAFHTFAPDFLVEMTDGAVEIHEVKGTQFLGNPVTRSKFKAAEKFCKVRKMEFKASSKRK